MSKRFVTIVSDNVGGFSFHTSWKSACETYGWETTPRVPSSHEGHSIKKAPMDVQIKCLEAVEFINRKDVEQLNNMEDGDILFTVFGYDTEYLITCSYEILHEEADYHHGDRGREEISAAYDYVSLTGVTKLELSTDDGPVEITTDDWTSDQIIDNLLTDEILD